MIKQVEGSGEKNKQMFESLCSEMCWQQEELSRGTN